MPTFNLKTLVDGLTDAQTGEILPRGAIVRTTDQERVIKATKTSNIAKLVSIEPDGKRPSGKKVYLHQKYLYKIGGIESFNLNFARAFSKKHNLTYIFGSGDIEQIIELAKNNVNIVMDEPDKLYECDVLVLLNYDSAAAILDRVKAKKVYQTIHADWDSMRKMPEWHNFTWTPDERIDKVIAVSKAAHEGLKTAFDKPIESTIARNVLMPETDKPLVFLTLSRGSNEKGIAKIIDCAKRFRAAGKKFTWLLASTIDQANKAVADELARTPEVVMVTPGLTAKSLIYHTDYLVQLSLNEAYCYSVHEALQASVPVIGTDIPAFRECIENGVNGYLVKQDLSDLPIDQIFNHVPKFEGKAEPIDANWNKVLGGTL